jgi:hypothetical protein
MYKVMRKLLAGLFFTGAALTSGFAMAQGCVVARGAGMSAEHLSLTGFSDVEWDESRFSATAAYRSLNSGRHFVGTEEQHERRNEGSEVINHSDFLDLAMTYSIGPRTTATLTIPVVKHDRSQVVRANDAQRTILERFHTQSSGLGDLRISGSMWMRDPTKRPRTNLQLGLGIDAPTGEKDVWDDFDVYNAGSGTIGKQRRTVDQSIQPGDGGWGLLMDVYAYARVGERTHLYANGFYTLTPEEKNGVPTFRSNPFESEMSISDSYMARAGVEHAMPLRLAGTLMFSLGARIEGVPVHDLMGGSEGFRRPGYAVSIEPGVSAKFGSWSASLYAPVAFQRNRERSVADARLTESSGIFRHGDAAFADYTVNFSVTKRFGVAPSMSRR